MIGKFVHEKEINVSASEAWKVFGSLQLAEISSKSLPHMLEKVEVVQGDGGVGTILELFFPKGTPGLSSSYKEKFTVVDDEKMIKETEVVEGGFLDLGFTCLRIRFQMIEKDGDKNSCIMKGTIEYEVKEEYAANASFVSVEPVAAIIQVAGDYLMKQNNESAISN